MKKVLITLFFFVHICRAESSLPQKAWGKWFPLNDSADTFGRYRKMSPIDKIYPPYHSISPVLAKIQNLIPCASKEDFNYTVNTCNAIAVTLQSSALVYNSIQWSFDDGVVINGNNNPFHSFTNAGNHTITMIIDKGTCADTVIKTISLNILPADIITTPDTTICAGSVKQLRTKPALGFCWSPTAYLDNPNSPNPFSSTPHNITYYYTAEVTGNNIIVNGDFSQGNTGFTSEYSYATPNLTEGQYYVGVNPNAWNGNLSACGDHTSGNGNMMMINGSPVSDVNVWKQTIVVTPNTNYAFSTWIQALWPPNPAQLQFSINGKEAGAMIGASLPTCTLTRFYTTWNSGNNTSAVISLVNKNTAIQGNDFALDDISFAPVFIQKDSIIIKVEDPVIKTNNDTTICSGTSLQLNTTGSFDVFNWVPTTGLSNAQTANPTTTNFQSTRYIVTGTSTNGCKASDTVLININPGPVISKTMDTTICHDKTLQLAVNGGDTYTWLPTGSLSNLQISNPVASPIINTTYYVTAANSIGCKTMDSIKVYVKQLPAFKISGDTSLCAGISAQLNASGGNIYSWTPLQGLNYADIASPLATPQSSAVYTVKIKEATCSDSTSLSVRIVVLPIPDVRASHSNEIDCNKPVSQLNVSGAIIYAWQPSSTLNDSSSASPFASPALSTLYTVRGTDINGCSSYDSVKVLVTKTGELLVNLPNAFSPNGDSRNDCFGISRYAGLLQQIEFFVYDRFGVRVFYTNNALKCWDGRYKGKMQDPGTFAYVLKASTFCGTIFKKGIVMLLK